MTLCGPISDLVCSSTPVDIAKPGIDSPAREVGRGQSAMHVGDELYYWQWHQADCEGQQQAVEMERQLVKRAMTCYHLRAKNDCSSTRLVTQGEQKSPWI
jgi:hypothetical protein